MHNWFECKIRYEKIAENGMNKKVTEPYLVDALSFTEAESRIIEEITPFISGEFTVSDIKRANYSELFPSDEEAADRWFKCKLYFITLDEKSGAEKKTATNVLVQAADLRDAVKKLDARKFSMTAPCAKSGWTRTVWSTLCRRMPFTARSSTSCPHRKAASTSRPHGGSTTPTCAPRTTTGPCRTLWT